MDEPLELLKGSLDTAEAALKDLRAGASKGTRELVRDLEKTVKHVPVAYEIAHALKASLQLASADESAQVGDGVAPQCHRGEQLPSALAARTVVLGDDGLITGQAARAAAQMLRCRGATRIVLAVPVGAPQVIKVLRADIDEILCLDAPSYFPAIGYPVGWWYEDVTPASSAEVDAAGGGGRARASQRRSWGLGGTTFEPACPMGPLISCFRGRRNRGNNVVRFRSQSRCTEHVHGIRSRHAAACGRKPGLSVVRDRT